MYNILRTDRRPTDLSFGKISNGDISATDHPIHSVFDSRVGFSASADRMVLFPVWPKPRWRLSRHIGKFIRRFISSTVYRIPLMYRYEVWFSCLGIELRYFVLDQVQ